MFIVTDTFRDLPFIQRAECGYLRADPALKFCRIQFASTQLQDKLFSQYAVALPPSLTGAVVKRKAEYGRALLRALFAAAIRLPRIGVIRRGPRANLAGRLARKRLAQQRYRHRCGYRRG